jgi:hypothetical protein
MYQPNEHELALARGSLLELEDALVSMHGTGRRLAMRDFTVWPVSDQFMPPEAMKKFEERQKEEKAKMWNHSQR